MGENTPEVAISPVQSVESSPPKVKKSFFPKISLPNPVRLFKKRPSPEAAVDITPAAQATDFVPPAAAIENSTSPVNAVASEIHNDSAPIDTVAKNVEADLTAQMAAHVNSIPGTARPPEVVGFAAPTNPPAETVAASPMATEAGAVTPTPIRTENPLEPPTPTALTEETAA